MLALVAAAAAAVVIWVLPNDSSASKDPASGIATAAPSKPSKTQQYFNDLSKAVKNGELDKQAPYVAKAARSAFVQGGVLMFPKGTKVTFLTDTLVADTSTTGHMKAVANGAVYTVLLVNEKDTSSAAATWHISGTVEVKG